mmetsp:Transcript_22030/g.40012  ORF Transcript_22030/g.40012 Transcript_22030/m.40012 type:complete len:139 (-) Transcript_22030:115-531(-)
MRIMMVLAGRFRCQHLTGVTWPSEVTDSCKHSDSRTPSGPKWGALCMMMHEGEASRIFGIPTDVTLGAPQWGRFGKAVKISEGGLSLFVAANLEQGQQTAVDVFSFVDDDWNKTQCIVGEEMVVALAALSISLKIGAS